MLKLKSLLFEVKAMEFVRYGGLSPVKQRGFSTHPETFHTPPARKGIYAFPRFAIEPFLLSGNYGNKRKSYVKDKDGNKISNEHPDWEKYMKSNKYGSIRILKKDATPDEDGDYNYNDYIHYVTQPEKPKIFKHNVDLWHHLSDYITDKDKIKKERGSWVLTDINTYKKAWDKHYHHAYKLNKGRKDYQYSNPLNHFTKDHLEVFIERIK